MFIHTFGDGTTACTRLPGQKLCALISDSAAHLRHYLKLPRVPSVWKHQRQLAGLHHLIYGEYRCRLFMCVLPPPQLRSCCRLTLAFTSESRLTEKFAITTRNLQAVKDKALNCPVWSLFPLLSGFWSRMSMCFVTFRGLNLHWDHRQDAITASVVEVEVEVEISVSSTRCFLEHFLPCGLIFLADEKNSWMFLAANLAFHSRVAIFAYVPNTQAAETDSPPPSENFGQCVLFSSRGRCSDHESNTGTS